MKRTVLYLSIFSFLFISNNSFAQFETGVPLLSFPVSPSTIGMGTTGASLPNDDPCGFLQNPAQLGNFGRTTNLGFSIYPASAKLWNLFSYKINNYALSLGYNFFAKLNIPVSVGIGFSRTNYLIEDFGYTNDIYSTFSIGAGIDYYVQLNAGISLKHISSELGDIPPEFEFRKIKATVNAFDFGLLINVPVLKLLDEKLQLNIIKNNPVYPFFNFSAGYSQLNNGNEIYYIDPAQADPLPRLAKLGYGLSLGLNMPLEKNTLKVLEFDFTVDAEDLLIDKRWIASQNDSVISIGYQSGFGDINLGKNIFSIKGDDNVLSRAGYKIDLFEIISFSKGHFSGQAYSPVKTYGLEIKSDGILKLIVSDEYPALNYIVDHFGLRFSYSNYFVREEMQTNYYGVSLFAKGFNSLF